MISTYSPLPQSLLETSSQVAGSSLSWRAWPAQWTVVVPAHWTDHQCGDTTFTTARGRTRYTAPHVVLEAHSTLGVAGPLALQSRGCGSPGDHISLPLGFLLATNVSSQQAAARARQLAHQFVKLRFGVFDERGYPGDLLYPGHYKVGGRIYPTGATDQSVRGVWLGLDGSPECRPDTHTCMFQPQGDNRQVTCSLAHLPGLPSVRGYCAPGQAALPTGPSKQAVLCGARSVLEVISASQDWAQLNVSLPRTSGMEERRTRVDFVRARVPRYVLVLEVSASMAEDWKFINKALQKLIRHDLPDSAELGVVTFSNVSRVEAVLSQVEGSRGRLADSVPDLYRLARNEGRCLLCGVNAALQEVLGEDKEGAHLVLVTRGGPDTLSLGDEATLRQVAEYHQVKLSSVLVPRLGKVVTFYDKLAVLSGGRTTFVMGDGPVQRFREICRALEAVVEGGDREVVVAEELVEVQGEGGVSEGEFLVDAGLGRKTQLGIYVEDEEEHLVRSVSLWDTEGRLYGPYTRISTRFDATNLKTLSVGPGEEWPLAEISHVGRLWRWRVEWHGPRGVAARQAAVVVVSRARGEDLSLEVWSSSEQSTDIVTPHHPLVLYVRVGRGGRPVLAAQVTLQGRLVISNGTVVELGTMVLGDGGEGGPDLMAEDGVYSGTWREYPGPGRYTFTAVAEGRGQAVVALPSQERDPSLCCGRTSGLAEGEVERLGQWRREGRLPLSINLLEVPGPGVVLGAGPARIVDLEARLVEGGVELGWTSPGEGRVAGYRLLQAASVSLLLEGRGELLVQWQREEEGSQRSTYQLQLPARDQEVFLSLLASDTTGNLGPLSNIVSVVVPSVGVEGAARTVEEGEVGEDEESDEWMVILGLCASLLLLALLLMAGILYFLRCGRTRKMVEDATDSSSTSSCTDPKNCSSHHLMPELMAELSTRNLEPRPFSAPPASLPDSTPTYWSASQLLTEHEQRALASSYGPLPPIREELYACPEERGGLHNPGFGAGHGTPVHGLLERGAGHGTPVHGLLERGAGHGTPVHGLLERGAGRSSQASTSSVHSGLELAATGLEQEESWIYGVGGRSLGRGGDLEQEEPPSPPARFSTAVQTVAPSTIATLRQNNTYLSSSRSRSPEEQEDQGDQEDQEDQSASTLATLRQNTSYLASIRSRSVSLV